ncbi:hypothetical protein [Pseudomonas purpurea]
MDDVPLLENQYLRDCIALHTVEPQPEHTALLLKTPFPKGQARSCC